MQASERHLACSQRQFLNLQHGDPVSEREVARGLLGRNLYLTDPSKVQQQGGFSLLDLKRFANGRGYEGTGYGRLTVRRLSELAPAIVPVNFNGYNHFVVFRGVIGKHVLLADPAFGNRIVSGDRFEQAWLDYPEFGRVGFTVKQRDGAAPSNQLAPDPADLIFVPDAVLRTALPFASRP